MRAGAAHEARGDAAAPMRWLYRHVRPHLRGLAGVLVLSLAATALALAQPYLTKHLIDDALLAGRFDLLIVLCAALAAAAALSAALGGLNRWRYVGVSSAVLFDLRETLYRHVQTLSPQWFGRSRGGDIVARLDGDVAEIQRFAVDTLLASVNATVALAGALALMLFMSRELTLIAAVALPLQLLFLRRIRPAVEGRTRSLRERAADLASFFYDTLPAMKLTQSAGAEQREAARHHALNRAYVRDLLRLEMAGYAAGAVPALLGTAATAAVFVVGGWRVIEGQLTVGTLVAFVAYLARASGPVQTLLGLYVAARRARVSLVRVGELLAAEPEVRAPALPVQIPELPAGAIRIEQVRFGYRGGPPLLDGAEAIFRAGCKTAVVGASGAGKSTLVDLLQRHYDPEAGRITLDGHDLRQLDLAALRRRIAVVAQDIILMPASIAENIAYAAPGATIDRVREAARLAQLDDEIVAMPAAYDTRVGSRGATLSGGQRQRLAIARALLQDPVVLILDEATSAVDGEAAARIAASIDQLFAGRTRIVVSHHPAALAGADHVYRLEHGRLLEIAAAGERAA